MIAKSVHFSIERVVISWKPIHSSFNSNHRTLSNFPSSLHTAVLLISPRLHTVNIAHHIISTWISIRFILHAWMETWTYPYLMSYNDNWILSEIYYFFTSQINLQGKRKTDVDWVQKVHRVVLKVNAYTSAAVACKVLFSLDLRERLQIQLKNVKFGWGYKQVFRLLGRQIGSYLQLSEE